MKYSIIISIFLLLVITSCDDDNGGINSDLESINDEVISPPENTFSESKSELGRLLFWDPVLSGNQDVACATCHHPDHGYGDGLPTSLGIGGIGLGPNRQGGTLISRNSPTIINTAFNGLEDGQTLDPNNSPMFWDNRANSLEEQSIMPLLSAEEMRGPNYNEDEIIDVVINRLKDIPEYVSLFDIAFNGEDISEATISKAIASFERSIIATNSRYDQYLRGNQNALTNLERRGLDDFMDRGCMDCHSGSLLSDFDLHVLGIPDTEIQDLGANGTYAFRTPSLRNVALTAPYMHNGIFNNLNQVLNYYRNAPNNRNNVINQDLNVNDLDDDLRDLRRGQNNNAIIAFLNTLTDTDFDKEIPSVVPSGGEVGGNINLPN